MVDLSSSNKSRAVIAIKQYKHKHRVRTISDGNLCQARKTPL